MKMSLSGNAVGISLGLFCLLIVAAFFSTSEAIWGLWMSDDNPTYSHGPLLLLVSIWIFVQEWRARKAFLHLKISILPIILLAGLSFLWFLAALGTVQIVQMLALVLIIALIFWSVLGIQQSLIFLFPILLMLCALPVWDGLGYYLQVISAVIVGELASWTISPTVREGMFILIPAGTFEVASGCSGLSYFIVSIIISLLYVYFNRIPLRQAGYYVLAAMAIAIVSNIIRVYTIVLSGQLTNMQSYFITGEHVSLGWVIFGISITAYLIFLQRFLPGKAENSEKLDSEKEESENVRKEPAPEVTLVTAKHIAGLVALCLCVFIGPIAEAYYQDSLSQDRSFAAYVPQTAGDWEKYEYLSDYHPKVRPGNFSLETGYQHTGLGTKVFLYLNYFYSQRQGEEAINDLDRMADGRTWQKISAILYNPGLEKFDEVQEYQLSARNGDKKLIWRWYETNGVRTGLGWKAKLHNILGILKGDPAITMYVLAVPLALEIESSRLALRDFVKSSQSKIHINLSTISE